MTGEVSCTGRVTSQELFARTEVLLMLTGAIGDVAEGRAQVPLLSAGNSSR
ncbi:MAG: hypothetical protein M3066_02110 [Actinomycetota bacterium]|nr:hypothetical protein [Actinomycetota bacterium]